MNAPKRCAVIMLCALPALCAATELGRLFLSTAERAELDRQRQSASIVPTTSVTSTTSSTRAGADDGSDHAQSGSGATVTVNGYIARSAGAPTVWVNGADTTGTDLSDLGVDSRHLRIDAARVRLPRTDGSGGILMLKPGQSFDPSSNQVSDAYERSAQP